MRSFKQMARNSLVWPPINGVVKRSLRPFAHHIPHNIIQKIPVVGPISVELPNGRQLRLETDGRDTYASLLYWMGPFGVETQTTKILPQLLQQAQTFFDIGANTGTYALLAALYAPKCRVFAFEPVPEVFAFLQKNIQANGLHNVEAERYAMGAAEGEVTLYVNQSLRLPAGASLRDNVNDGVRISVPLKTLDTFVNERRIERVDVMKIDTETTEPDVLQGAQKVLERHAPIIICEVLHNKTEQALHNVLDTQSYKYFLITIDGLVQKQRIVGDEINGNVNYLFVPEHKLMFVEDLLVRS